jgi:outer membrane protein assembly factor BamB
LYFLFFSKEVAMRVIRNIDVSGAHELRVGRKLSLYSLLTEDGGSRFLVGCGVWDRERMSHTNAVKDETPGVVLAINRNGRILARSELLANIVYPLVRLPWGGVFVGCRTGAMYVLDPASPLCAMEEKGTLGGGIYGVASMQSGALFLLGTRDGFLHGFEAPWQHVFSMRVSDDRLWNLCMDPDCVHVWASSYNGKLFCINLITQEIAWEQHLGAGAVTYIASLQSGMMAVGCMARCVKLFRGTEEVMSITVPSPVCFVQDLPVQWRFLATGYRGEIWVFDDNGKCVDEFTLDSRENNPIWIAQPVESPTRIAFAWANGVIRIIDLS